MTFYATLATALAVLIFLGTVAWALIRIVGLLDSIGGRGDSYLAKLRLGLRAIERETSHIPGAVPDVNDRLGKIAGGLTAVDATFTDLHAALKAQEK